MEEREITLWDIPEGSRMFAASIGLGRYLELVEMFGGEMLYIPTLDQLHREARNREIRTTYRAVGNSEKRSRRIAALSRIYHLSDRQIRNIVRKEEEDR